MRLEIQEKFPSSIRDLLLTLVQVLYEKEREMPILSDVHKSTYHECSRSSKISGGSLLPGLDKNHQSHGSRCGWGDRV